jgi:hypothetical protein
LKKNFIKGNIQHYRLGLDRLITREATFTSVISGMSRKVIFPSGAVFKYFGSPNTNTRSRIPGAHLVPMVQREIDKYTLEFGKPEYERVKDVQNFNVPLIKKAIEDKRYVIGVDINSCYWTTAKKLGYISEDLYNKTKGKFQKQAFLISIGCLAKRPVVRQYVAGKLVQTTFDDETYEKYAPFYWNIIKETYDVMIKSWELFSDGWYMYLTDCLFVDKNLQKISQEFLKDNGYESKYHKIQFKSLQNFCLTWYDFSKKKDKNIYVYNRDIASTYNLDKIKRSIIF